MKLLTGFTIKSYYLKYGFIFLSKLYKVIFIRDKIYKLGEGFCKNGNCKNKNAYLE